MTNAEAILYTSDGRYGLKTSIYCDYNISNYITHKHPQKAK